MPLAYLPVSDPFPKNERHQALGSFLKALKNDHRVCSLDAVSRENPLNITFDKGTPIAGVFAGMRYATAMVSYLFSQILGNKKEIMVCST